MYSYRESEEGDMIENDVSNEGDLESHLLAWEALGFDKFLLREQTASIKPSEVAEFHSMIESAQHVKNRMEPFRAAEPIDNLLNQFINPNDWEATQRLFLEWTRDNAPWESGYYRWYPKWEVDEERRSQFRNIMNLSATLDESSWTSLDLLLPLMGDSENYSNIIDELEQLVQDEQRQHNLLEKAVLQLKEKGYSVDLESLKIIEQFDEVERLQRYSNQIDLIQLQIQSNIVPFDPVLADTFMGRVEKLIQTPSDDLQTLEKNVTTIAEHLQTRLDEMNALIRLWHSEGYIYQSRSRILPEELLEWEHLLPEIEQQYHRHKGAFERWKEIKKLWNHEDASIEHIVGKLEHTDAFLDKIDALEQQWTEKELQGASRIERWEQLGFEMDVWRYKITQDPRQGLDELNQQLPFYERANTLLEKLLQLDTSLGGEEETENRSTILRTMDLDADLLDEMQHWLDKKTLRNARHRRMLQTEWERAVREGKADPDKTFTDLHTFETAVASLEHRSQNLMASGATSHAIERTKADLLRLEERGWSITELLQLQEQQPDAFFQQFSQAVEAMSRIQSTQRRFANMDWRRDVQRASEVSINVRNPLQLMKLEQQIPALIRHLAEREIEDEAYSYPVWLPEQRPILLPKEQNRIRKAPAKNQPQSTLEEAHEAMLEAMVESEPTQEEEMSEIVQPDTHSNDEKVEILVQDQKEKFEEISKPVADITPSTIISGDVSSYERLLRQIGLTREADTLAASGDISTVRRALASHVGEEPRDIRIDRMLRLVLRLLPVGDHDDSKRSKMIDDLGEAIPKYNQWVRMRLESRHMGASGDFFEDATRLGIALNRVPGPGVRVPLNADELSLPETSNMNELQQQTERLVQSMNLPTAGGIN